jgi:hypothetical protein
LLFAFGFSLLQVIIPVMTLQAHILRLEVAAAEQQFHVLNRDRANKLSQLSIYVSFTLWATCLGYVHVYVAQTFHTVKRACLPCSPV